MTAQYMPRKHDRNWLVLFQPSSEITVSTMRVIDAWSSNCSKELAEKVMKDNMAEYYKKHGTGRMLLIENPTEAWQYVHSVYGTF